MPEPTDQTTVSWSKSVQSEVIGKPTSVVDALGLKKTKDIFSDSHKNWLSNGKQDSIENKIEQDIECARISRPSRSTFDLKTSLTNGPYLHSNDSSSSNLRTASVKSLELQSGQLNDPLNNIDIPLATSYSSQSDHSQSAGRTSLKVKLSLSTTSAAFSSPHLIGMKSPYRRTTVSDSQIRSSSFPSSSGGSQESQKSEALSTKLLAALPAPAPAMYWRKIADRGERPPHPLRAHSATLVRDKIVIFGGCNTQACYNDVYVFDTDTMYWSRPQTTGTPPSPRRAHSATLVSGLGIIVFGGGNSSSYYNDLHILDTGIFCSICNSLFWCSNQRLNIIFL
ncbi:hypothetical protein DSO57_1031799 [Entomophthora muscae]|uniref:Uncharacterized protein n=1 Tax=Entomophthora muscae TaxID=34485 RepID=A0ACC2TZ59_9FUNG|nr:hypothetical protein DSO57_1031799 [Entomophthora muscae]